MIPLSVKTLRESQWNSHEDTLRKSDFARLEQKRIYRAIRVSFVTYVTTNDVLRIMAPFFTHIVRSLLRGSPLVPPPPPHPPLKLSFALIQGGATARFRRPFDYFVAIPLETKSSSQKT